MEINRMARQTQDAEVLRELWSALHNDPYLIAECLARPILVDGTSMRLPGFDEWWAKSSKNISWRFQSDSFQYRLPEIVKRTNPFHIESLASAGSWTALPTTGAPAARFLHTAVWTGTQMIIWGGGVNGTASNTGGRYTASTNSWSSTALTNAPSARNEHTAIWTGSQMIVWGGIGTGGWVNTGAKYNPSANSWTAITTTGAPAARSRHTAVWTGSRMIVWGGFSSAVDKKTGGQYNPTANTWTATTTTGAPSARESHTAVWTGSVMVVWGGNVGGGAFNTLNTGGRYNPSTNSWTATTLTGAPSARQYHSAVWAASKVIIWGGSNGSSEFNTGGRYNPVNDTWAATSTTGAPSARDSHVAVSNAGNKMIVWGAALPEARRQTPAGNMTQPQIHGSQL